MKKGRLICFMGVDGSGKTTLSNKLVNAHNSNFRYVWCKFGQNGKYIKNIFKNFSFLVLKKNKEKKLEDFPGKTEIKDNFFSKIYLIFIIAIHNLEIIRKVSLPLKLGNDIVCDRYLPDTLVDLILEFHYNHQDALILLDRLVFVPKPDKIFYIKISPLNAFKRKKENNLEYLSQKKFYYDDYCKKNKITVLNGNLKPEELLNEILLSLNKV